MEQSSKNYKRIVVKVGSSLFYSPDSALGDVFFSQIARQINALMGQGKEVVIVSSGAITLGAAALQLREKPKELSSLQAVAAIGQSLLMDRYNAAFKIYNKKCAQVLLTWEDLHDRKRYLNAKNTLSTLFTLGGIPVINENDTISADEIKFGDNDRLSALVAALVNADLLIILSDVDGLWDNDKKIIRVVDRIDPSIKALACPSAKKTCVGGMVTKIEAAKISTDSGIPCVIANGHSEDIILSVVEKPLSFGTTFLSKKALGAKERWLAFSTKPKGRIIVDDGAKKALFAHKSLLCVGILSAQGNFEAKDIISILDKEKREFARGKASLSCKMIEKLRGTRHEKEAVHCDHIALLD